MNRLKDIEKIGVSKRKMIYAVGVGISSSSSSVSRNISADTAGDAVSGSASSSSRYTAFVRSYHQGQKARQTYHEASAATTSLTTP